MTPAEFIAKWSKVQLTERAAAQQHFLDLCALLGQEPPAKVDPAGEWFCFERGASKRSGGEGWADVWKKGFFGWEYKGKRKDLDAAYQQLLDYREALESPPLLVVCDLDRIVVRTNFTNTPTQRHEIALERLAEPRSLEVLRAVFFDPESLRPGRVSQAITQAAAEGFGALAQALRERGIEPRHVARFVDRLVFCLFAEDVGVLPNGLFTRLLEQARARPELFPRFSASLFGEMATGGIFGADTIPHIDGGLFADAGTVELTQGELDRLWLVAQLDWGAIDPSILGTLFERGLDPGQRTQLGAHYTSREDIETLIEPVVMAPLRREWSEARALVERLLATGRKEADPSAKVEKAAGRALTPAQRRKAGEEALVVLERFLRRLESVTVLDPACGSGNFLYVTLGKLKDLEAEVESFLIAQGFQRPLRVGVGPWQLFGIEINPYAHELAQLTVWLGYLQWLRQHGTLTWKEPILQAMSNIENKDAILDLSDPASPREPTWPKADFIVGNPPFLGGKMMRRELGDAYVDDLRMLYEGRLPPFSDLCCYWFERARDEIRLGRAGRAGLLGTQGIRGGANREVLKRIKNTGDIFWAESDRPWVLDGAAVHVSMVGFDAGIETRRQLDRFEVSTIHANLSSQADVTAARPLGESLGRAFIGVQKSGPFDLPEREAIALLSEPSVAGRPLSDVIRPYLTAHNLLQRSAVEWVVDLSAHPSEQGAARYDRPFQRLKELVPAERTAAHFDGYPFWLFWRPRPELHAAAGGLARLLVTAHVSKHHVFSWIPSFCVASNLLIVVTTDLDVDFGTLQSRVHRTWALAQGTQLREKESGFRYTPTTCFETFPFPYPESLSLPHPAALSSSSAAAMAAVGKAARELDELRSRWLNPPEWVKEEVLEFPGALDGPWARYVVDADTRGIGTVRWPRLVPRDAECAAKLAKRTLTNLYNERPAWLDLAHRKLDEAVFAAYCWPVDLPDEQLLERLLALNLERATGERA